ncbi:MAG: leucine-rich repeat protein, partial [Prevotella sp.]|nr:leucine-rich repeat protein [Prevotella sp.]
VERVVIAGTTSVAIGEMAFAGCSSLTQMDFTNVTSIGNSAFHGCPLKNIVLPKVTSLGNMAFGSNDESNASTDVGYAKYTIMLTTSSAPTFNEINFLMCDKGARLIVPASLKSQISALWDADAHDPQTNRMNRCFQMQEICVGGLLDQHNPRNFWMLRDNGTLWVVGAMPDFANASDAPWYSLRNQIQSVVVEGASSIGKNAFRGYTNLTSVLADEVSTIGDYALANCTKLNRADVLNVKTIGAHAFEGCTSLENINLRNAINTIGDNAFSGTGLKSIYLGLPLQSIGNNAFATTTLNNGDIYVNGPCPQTSSSAFGSVSSSTVTLHVSIDYADSYKANNVWKQFQVDKIVSFPVVKDTWSINQVGTLTVLNSIPDYAKPEDQPWYAYRDYIHSIVVKENVTKIGNNAFAFDEEGESHVEEVEIPASVQTVGENAFKNNDELVSFEGEGVKNIGSQAFENCSSLETVKFGKDVTSLGNKVFNNCGIVDVMAVKAATPPTVTAQTFQGLGVVSSNAPAKVKAKAAARRAKAATGQKTVTLEVPDAHIAKYLAAQYWNLFSFEYIGEHGGIVESDQAYDGVYVLYSDGTMIVSASAPTNPQDINVGFTISSNAKSKVKRVEIQGDLTKLGHQFRDCPNLEEVVLSGGINSLNGTFNNCPKLKTINLDNVTALKSHSTYAAFQNCTALTEVNLPNAAEIGDNCFKGCTALKTVTLGGNCEIGEQAFANCTALQSIDLGAANLNGALQAFQGCTALKRMSYQGTRMPAEIFKGCTALRSINLGGQLKDILSEAFANTAIDTIYVQCPTPPEAAANAFSGLTPSAIRVYVPAAFDDPYWSAPVWEDMFFYDDEDYDELDFPIHFAIGSNGWGVVDDQGSLTINAMGALVDNFRDYVEPYAPYIIGEIRIGNEVSSLPAGTP